MCLFFFSSRRRHTRCYRDWSSDVCSSDLLVDVRDVARAIASCCDLDSAGARTYNVGTGVAVAISDVVGALVGLAKVPVRLELDPSLVRGGPPTRIALDATALRTAVGWSPQVPLARSLAEGLDEWREQVRLR